MARKITGLQRVLDAPALFSVAYGEIASSIYVALGIIALHALGLTPEVLAIVGALFLVVTLSYAEGTTSIPETGGAATFVRRAFNDLVGFLTGWAIFLDYLIVIALSGLFLPHYLGAAMQWGSLEHNPWDVVVGVCVVLGVAALRLVRRSAFYSYGIFVAVLDLMTQLLLVVLGFAFLFSGDALTQGVSIGTHPSWHQIAFALPLAMLAYTGLETVANLAEETREPGRDLPRSLFSGIGLVVLIYVAIACVALSAFPAENGTTALGTDWLGSPLMGIVDALRDPLPNGLATALRVYVGLTGAVILLVAVTTSISGFTRLAHSLGEHGQLPRAFGRLNRRTLVSPQAIVAAALISTALMIGTSFVHDDIAFLASLFSFGVLAAFTAAQLAVIKLRFSEPDLPRPYRVPWNVKVRGVDVPVPSVVGSVATFAIWIAAMATHPGARYGGPAWLAAGADRVLARPQGSWRGLAPARAGAAHRVPGERVHEHPGADEARRDRRGDDRDRSQARPRPRRARRGPVRDPCAARPAARGRARRAGRGRGGLPGRGAAAWRRQRRRGAGRDGPRPLDRRRDRRRGQAARQRPDRRRLGAALAAAVALLLADGRIRPAQGALRGACRGLPGGRDGRGRC